MAPGSGEASLAAPDGAAASPRADGASRDRRGPKRLVLITGGAGFIGSHLADELLAHGHAVRALDSLDPQVHGPKRERPAYLDARVDLRVGDVRDRRAVLSALEGVDAVYHFAARVGVGQSMYEIAAYTGVNNLGTAVLLECLFDRPVGRLVVASSMSVYGEGLCSDAEGRRVEPAPRGRAQLETDRWEPTDERGRELTPVPTPESKRPDLASVYALGKFDQERMCLMYGAAYKVPTVALRFFNVYGTRQALSNPYTGVLAIFASRLLNGNPPMVFEDGHQRRDFVSVKDVARACRLALESDRAPGRVINVGSGEACTVRQVAERLACVLGTGIEPRISGKYRMGDIRHCFADISLAREVLGYEPRVRMEEGLAELSEWLRGQAAVDRVDAAAGELASRGLTL